MITYRDYKKLGYSAVPDEQFARFADMAEKAVQKFGNCGFGRAGNDVNVKRGLCEICDIYYAENQAGTRLAGFSNEGYREQYFEGDGVNKRVYQIIQFYFPRGHIFRGV